MQLFARAKFWNVALLLACGLFLLTRFCMLTALPIFNDEALYLQYAQSIHDDWKKNKFISMSDEEYDDWKPPLQYWLAAPVIRCGEDPLVAGRAVAVLVSFLGVVGTYLFARELFDKRAAVVAAFLFVLCPAVVFHNLQFTAETFLFSTAPLFYWALLKALGRTKRCWLWLVTATVAGTALLLFKQSGFLLMLLGTALPLARFRKNGQGGWDFTRSGRIRLAINLAIVAAVIFAANLAASAVIPVDFDATREQFDSLWVMSPAEILRLPMKIWARNLGMIADYIGAYYSWVVGLFYGACVWLAIRRRDFAEIALVLMCLAGGGAIIFLLRGFNEYMLNTAVVAVLLPSLAQGAVVMWDLFRGRTARLARGGLLVATAVTASIWCRQMVLMATTPGPYFEQSTKWAAANYLTSWPTGFGIKELVAMLEKEPGPGVIFADPQWGNLRTALQVYARRFPKLRVVRVTAEFTDAAKRRELRDIARRMGPTRLLIFSAGAASARGEMWTREAEREMCDTRTEIKAWPRQMPIVVCRF